MCFGVVCFRAVNQVIFLIVPNAGLFFTLSGTVYLPRESVLITDIGAFTGPTLEGAASSLVCDTRNVHTRCCRSSDNGGTTRVQAEWDFPYGNVVPANSGNTGLDFTSSRFTQQLRLNHRNNALMPTGNFTCRVPDERDSSLIHEASIALIVG